MKGGRLIVFDLDGTLVDSTADLSTAINATLRQLGPGIGPLPHEVVRRFVGSGAENLVQRCLAQAGVGASPPDVLPLFLDCYRRCLLDTTHLYPGVAEALEALGTRTLAVLTNKPGEMSRAILQGLGIARRFAHILGGGDVVSRKPDPAGLLGLLRAVGSPPEEALMVGDSSIDVLTGRAAGVGTIGVTYGFDPGSLAEVPPDLLLDDLRDLPRYLDQA